MARRPLHDDQDQLDLGTPAELPGIPPPLDRRAGRVSRADTAAAAAAAARNTELEAPATHAGRRFLSVWWSCCDVYGRLARNADETRFEGRCPSCGRTASARIGPGGTDRRIFTTTD